MHSRSKNPNFGISLHTAKASLLGIDRHPRDFRKEQEAIACHGALPDIYRAEEVVFRDSERNPLVESKGSENLASVKLDGSDLHGSQIDRVDSGRISMRYITSRGWYGRGWHRDHRRRNAPSG